MATTAVLVVSSAVAAGGAEDRAGPLLARLSAAAGGDVTTVDSVADDRREIEVWLRSQVAAGVQVVLTAGGTGLTRDDVTPEASGAVIERLVPGLAEALRAEAVRHTPMGALTRGLAGVARETLIVNLPGSPKAIEEAFGVLAPVLEHAVALICSPGGSRGLHAAAGGEA